MFREGDYIVITRGLESGGIHSDVVYKQRRTLDYISMEKDSVMDENGTSQVRYENKTDWRYATKSEVFAYNQNQAPVNILHVRFPFDKNSLDIRELSCGKHYKYTYGDGNTYINKISGIDNTIIVAYLTLNTTKDFDRAATLDTFQSSVKMIEHASQEEIRHFEQCEKAGKYVDYSAPKGWEPSLTNSKRPNIMMGVDTAIPDTLYYNTFSTCGGAHMRTYNGGIAIGHAKESNNEGYQSPQIIKRKNNKRRII